MELRHLRYFLAIAERSHFGEAAEELMVSQPTLSQQMKDLESELGCALFERVGRGVKLSQAGELYREVARRALSVLEEGESMLREFEQLLRGSLSIGVVQTVNAYLIPPVATKFVREYPKVKLLIEELSADEIEDRLGKAMLDLGISFAPSTGVHLTSEPLFEEELVLVVHSQHRWSKRKSIQIKSIADEPLSLLRRGYCTRRIIDEAFRSAEARLHVAVELNSIAGLLAVVQAGGPPTILPKLGVNSNALHMVRLEKPTPKRTVCLLTAKSKPALRARDVFIELLRTSHAPSLPK
jgi:LysR family transcriptional regulator, cyn operon transcriptional activator